ncbi:ribonuclease H2, subunit B [Aspergillus pseudodeflectus]|uniref:Ribonuclease H2 subunit B n=1 Tax=Aspergillus pseudodeflectus TaxID=176178 RepID=A0ABR4LA90_9EURO
MRTRSAPPPEQSVSGEQPQPQPSKATAKPSKAFILPSSASPDARFVTLPNPRTGDLTRYFFCPKLGLYEFTVVSSAAQSPRSILYTSSQSDGKKAQGTISKAAELAIATPIDIVFFVIPLLRSSPSSNKGKRLFQPLDDIIDSHDDLPKHLRYILCHEAFRETLLCRVDGVCDSVEAGDEKLFRVSDAKLLRQLLAKAERMISQGLPTSLEERYVKQALAAPLMSVTRTDITTSASLPSPEEDENEESKEAKDTQSTTTTITTASSTSVSTPVSDSAPTPAGEDLRDQQACPEFIIRLQRLSTALSFLKSTYVSPELSIKLDTILSGPETPVDFKPLYDHLKHLAELRAEALASRSFGDFSRKRNAENDDVAEARAEKKRRKEEEEKKKKAGESRGVRELKKVNTTGMKKMSDFFGKAAAKKRS